MRVLIGNKFYRPVGGPETIVFDTARELESLGHQAITFAMTHPDNRESKYSDYFVSSIDYNSTQSKGIERLLKEASDIIYSREAREKIEKLIADTRPDIAHLHNIYHQLSPSILVALKKARIPTIVTLHDPKLLCSNYLLLRRGSEVCERCRGKWYHHAVLNKCVKDSYASSLVCCIEGIIHRVLGSYERNTDLFITPSRWLKDKMVEHGRLKADQIEVLYNYADTKSFTPNYTPGDYGLFLGKVEGFKGVRTLLRACRQIPDFEIRFAGRGTLMDEGKRTAADERLRVDFLGFQTGEDLNRQISESRFVLLPAEWYENCPMVILEAFSAGKPVIASNMGGIPELVDHGADGLIFEAGNADELASCMRRLIDDPALASDMGRRGRAKVEERFSIEKYMESLLAIYERLLSRRGGKT